METQQALVKTEPDAIALVVHDGTGSNDCELQSSTSDPWSSISIAGCGDASIPASTVFENDVKTLVVMPSGTEDIVQTLAFQTLENSAAVSSGSIPLNILHSEPVSIDAVGESGIQIPVDCSASGASIKLEPVDPGYEETYPDTVQAPDISIVKTEDDSAIPTGLYKNVYIKPEPAGSSESSAATVSSAAAQEPVATTSVGNLESPLEVADRSFQIFPDSPDKTVNKLQTFDRCTDDHDTPVVVAVNNASTGTHVKKEETHHRWDSGDDETSDGEEIHLPAGVDRYSDLSDGDCDELRNADFKTFIREQFVRRHAARQCSDSDSHAEVEEAEECPVTDSDLYITRGGSQWSAELPSVTSQTKLKNIYRVPQSQIQNTSKVLQPSDAFSLFVSEKIINSTVRYTNQEGVRLEGHKWQPTDEVEMRALVGCLLVLGSTQQNTRATTKIWDALYGSPFARSCLSRERFVSLLACLQLDDKSTRQVRQEKDPFAAFREVWNEFMSNLSRYYVAGPFITIDEQLVPFRGRCAFTQYVSSKPDPYGIKIFWAVDSETNFPLFALPCLGNSGNEHAIKLERNTVIELAKPFFYSGRNVTCGKYIMDKELSSTLLKNSVTCVGKVRQSQKFLPEKFKQKNALPLHDTEFAFQQDTTLAYYQSEKDRSVVVLSTLHNEGQVDLTEQKKTPDIVLFYNSTKGAVDTLDKMARAYTTRRKTKRWSLLMFYNMLDLSTIAARCIWTMKFPDSPLSHQNARVDFIQRVGEQLILAQVQRRMTLKILSTSLRQTAKIVVTKVCRGMDGSAGQKSQKRKAADMVQEPGEKDPTSTGTKRRRGRCCFCDWRRDAKTTASCAKCAAWVCKQHVVTLCPCCATADGSDEDL